MLYPGCGAFYGRTFQMAACVKLTDVVPAAVTAVSSMSLVAVVSRTTVEVELPAGSPDAVRVAAPNGWVPALSVIPPCTVPDEPMLRTVTMPLSQNGSAAAVLLAVGLLATAMLPVRVVVPRRMRNVTTVEVDEVQTPIACTMKMSPTASVFAAIV